MAGLAKRELPAAADLGPVGALGRVDELDRRIIEALQDDGRESFREIAAGLGVSEATVRNRYKRLRQANILRVTGVTNPLGLGFDAIAMIGVKTSGPPDPVADEIAEWLEASYVVVAAGHFDLLVELVCVDRKHLLQLTNRIRSLDRVVATESFVYLELRKQLYNWGTRLDVAGAGEASAPADGARPRQRRKPSEAVVR